MLRQLKTNTKTLIRVQMGELEALLEFDNFNLGFTLWGPSYSGYILIMPTCTYSHGNPTMGRITFEPP